MQSEYIAKLLALQKLAGEDECFLSVLEEYRAMDQAFLKALDEMDTAHREIVMDYMGAVHAANTRMLELALSMGEKG